jgi:polar amino acid transport system substrate-binding protein
VRRVALPVVVLALTVVVAGCTEAASSDIAGVLDALPQAVPETTAPATGGATTTPTTTTTPSQGECAEGDLETRSLRPDGKESGEALDAIRERGTLRVGVDENTAGFSYRNPQTGDIEGFEVELASIIAARIFGDDGAGRVDLKPVVTSEKFDVVEDGRVDMTISANSMSCGRWEGVAFSSEYYTAHQQFLVRADSTVDTVDDLDGATVCVTTRSSSIGLLRELAPAAVTSTEDDRTGCLLALREGEADAYFGHDSFLYGMLTQDPNNVKILADLLPAERVVSHYGIAISHDHPDLVRFVNAVLEDVRTDGTWHRLHEQLEAEIGVPPDDPPEASYRD